MINLLELFQRFRRDVSRRNRHFLCDGQRTEKGWGLKSEGGGLCVCTYTPR